MKLSTIAIIFLLGQGMFVQAQESSIDAQIAKIQNAPENERYLLVNELKKQIAQMNALQQARAISRYQEDSLKVEQNNANIANQILIDDQEKQIQEQQIIIPAVKKTMPIVPSGVPEDIKVKPEIIPDIDIKNTPVLNIEEVQDHVQDIKEEVQTHVPEVEKPQEYMPNNEEIKENIPQQEIEEVQEYIPEYKDIQENSPQPEVDEYIPEQEDIKEEVQTYVPEVENTPQPEVQDIQEYSPEPEEDYSPEPEIEEVQEQNIPEPERVPVVQDTPQETNSEPTYTPSTPSRPSGRF